MTKRHVQDNGFWEEVERRGYSLRKFAPLVGYHVAQLSRIKRGVEPTTYKFALAASAALGVPVEQFFLQSDLPDGSTELLDRSTKAA